MIEVTCGDCEHTFGVPDIRAGLKVFCAKCGELVPVPTPGSEATAEVHQRELVGAAASSGRGAGYARERVQQPDGPMGGAGDCFARSTYREPQVLEEEWESEATGAYDAGERTLEPGLEDDARRRNLFRLGLALAISFILPIAGVPGQFLAFPQFSAFPGLNLAGFVLLLPLIAGLAVMWSSKCTEPPVRSVVTLSAGAMLFLAFLVHSDSRALISGSFGALPGSVTLSALLFFAGACGLVVGARTRWYRPASPPAHWIGAIAAGCYLLYLVIPVNGSVPIAQPFQMFGMHKMLGLAMISHVALMVTAGVFCLRNTPSTLSSEAAERAERATRFLVLAIAVPFVLFSFAAMSMPGGGPTMFISTAVKFGVMFGGLLLLIPIGIVDLLVGRP